MMKRWFDVLAASAILVVTWPLLLLGVLAVRLTLGRPVFFRQTRPGRHGELFVVNKLRTMRDGAPGHQASDAARTTKVGRVLRSTSIDELPQLVSVLRGEMSLVGPRPLLPEYLDRYSPRQARRHEVRPGLTGWAQVHGRNDTTWDERIEYDVWYVDNRTFWLDLRIIAMTVLTVLRRSGTTTSTGTTMAEFEGSAT